MAAGKFIKFKEGNWNQIKDGPYAEYNYMEWNSYYRMLNGLPPAYTLNDEKLIFKQQDMNLKIYTKILVQHL